MSEFIGPNPKYQEEGNQSLGIVIDFARIAAESMGDAIDKSRQYMQLGAAAVRRLVA